MVVDEIAYYDVLIFGSGAIILAGTLSSFFTGRGATRVVMAVDSAAAALNAVLAYLWIFGHGGFPRGGIAGAGAATVAAEWFRVACYAAIMMRPRYRSYRLGIGLALERRPHAPALDIRRRPAACNGWSNAAPSRSSSCLSAGWIRSSRPPRCWPSTSIASPGCR